VAQKRAVRVLLQVLKLVMTDLITRGAFVVYAVIEVYGQVSEEGLK
jgi:hypothetical protein